MGKQKENKRKLSKAEQRRKNAFILLTEQLEAQGFKTHDFTLGLVYVNIMSVVVTMPFLVLLAILFLRIHGHLSLLFNFQQYLLFIIVYLILIIVHELIHGITFALFAKEHLRSISFGFIVQYLTPYCTCKEPLKKSEYLLSVLMPTILLGIIPCLVSIFNGSSILFVLGAFMIIGGGGDILISLKLLRNPYNKDAIYIDHPYQCGFVAFVKEY